MKPTSEVMLMISCIADALEHAHKLSQEMTIEQAVKETLSKIKNIEDFKFLYNLWYELLKYTGTNEKLTDEFYRQLNQTGDTYGK